WQDFMFANMDYPVADPDFAALVRAEAEQVLADLAHRPSLAVLCGNSEVEQQVAMLGLDPALGRGELFGTLLPDVARAAGTDAVYVPSAPAGGTLPFRFDQGVSNYFGVGGYRRPLTDARLAGVRFASECLALANVPDADPASREQGVMRDVGSEWDFADVRDHYLRELCGVDPLVLLAEDPARYYALSREVSGELMGAVFAEWRRPGSPCRGGIVLRLRDLEPGSGWGVLDHDGRPKVAWHHLRRALAPVAVWLTDEGLAGVAVHVANDRGEPLGAVVRIALYRDGEVAVGEVRKPLELAAHSAVTLDVEGLLGHFVDVSWAYRFGPPQQDAIVASLERDGEVLAQDVLFPVGAPATVLGAEELGLEAELDAAGLLLSARRVVHGVRIVAPGQEAADDAFALEPGHPRHVGLRPATGATGSVEVRALNLRGSVVV
ncbi:MAG: beta-mannosidase, partial [Solirubrobacteraceae bacterium]|nr:beta-mannosidase [Solirubrobacteraceae bacterium]